MATRLRPVFDGWRSPIRTPSGDDTRSDTHQILESLGFHEGLIDS